MSSTASYHGTRPAGTSSYVRNRSPFDAAVEQARNAAAEAEAAADRAEQAEGQVLDHVVLPFGAPWPQDPVPGRLYLRYLTP